jgi:hypothetical protein
MANGSENEASGMTAEKAVPTEMPITGNSAPSMPPEPVGTTVKPKTKAKAKPAAAKPPVSKSAAKSKKKPAAKLSKAAAKPKAAKKAAKTAKTAAKKTAAKPVKAAAKKKAKKAGSAQPKLDANAQRQRKVKTKANQGRLAKTGMGTKVAGHVSARGRRQQARRDAKNTRKG